MLASSTPRICKDTGKKREYTVYTYRKALPELLDDFGQRCAYSLQHSDRMGKRIMEVDHHNPKLKGRKKHHYLNLFPAHRICNSQKLCTWPTRAQHKKGLRFLNARKEADYNCQIFEDPESFRLIGTTPAAKYHIRHCALNDPYFVNERRVRAEIRRILNSSFLELNNDCSQLTNCIKIIDMFSRMLKTMIPAISPPPPG